MGNEIEERITRLEATVSGMSKRIDDLKDSFNHRLYDLRWNLNIWFIILTTLIVIFKFLKF